MVSTFDVGLSACSSPEGSCKHCTGMLLIICEDLSGPLGGFQKQGFSLHPQKYYSWSSQAVIFSRSPHYGMTGVDKASFRL